MDIFELSVYAVILYTAPWVLIAYFDHVHKNQYDDLLKQNNELRKEIYDLQQRLISAEQRLEDVEYQVFD